jgi:DNA-nicking Smr family endonuclease
MADRRLSPDEAEIWAKVVASVRRFNPPRQGEGDHPQDGGGGAWQKKAISPSSPKPPPPRVARSLSPGGASDTLDGGWDRRLRRGTVVPDRSIDLHGHTLSSAHHLLDQSLERAVAEGVRVLLIVTGKPPRDPAPHRRGLIRASIGDWLAASRHAGRIAAVRNAHPRHGGTGALYVILRRERSE